MIHTISLAFPDNVHIAALKTLTYVYYLTSECFKKLTTLILCSSPHAFSELRGFHQDKNTSVLF